VYYPGILARRFFPFFRLKATVSAISASGSHAAMRAPALTCRIEHRVDLETDYETRLAAASDREPAYEADPEDGLVIIYTSGTTGLPKGVRYVGAMADLAPPHQLVELTQLLHAPYVNTFDSTEAGLPPATGATIAVGEVPTDLAKRISGLCQVKLVDADDNEVSVAFVPFEKFPRSTAGKVQRHLMEDWPVE